MTFPPWCEANNAVFLRVVWIKISKSTTSNSWRCCVYMTAVMQASLCYCSWPMLLPKNVCAQAYYYYPLSAAHCSSWQRTLGWVGRGTRVLNNLYAERVFKRNMRNTHTYLIWRTAKAVSSLRTEGLKERGKKTQKERLKGLSVFSLDHPFLYNDSSLSLYSCLVTLDDLLLLFYHKEDTHTHTGYTVPCSPT